MAEPWSQEFGEQVRRWCDRVAVLGVDAMVDAGLVAETDVQRATAIVAEEILVRLCLLDYPPVPELLR